MEDRPGRHRVRRAHARHIHRPVAGAPVRRLPQTGQRNPSANAGPPDTQSRTRRRETTSTAAGRCADSQRPQQDSRSPPSPTSPSRYAEHVDGPPVRQRKRKATIRRMTLPQNGIHPQVFSSPHWPQPSHPKLARLATDQKSRPPREVSGPLPAARIPSGAVDGVATSFPSAPERPEVVAAPARSAVRCLRPHPFRRGRQRGHQLQRLGDREPGSATTGGVETVSAERGHRRFEEPARAACGPRAYAASSAPSGARPRTRPSAPLAPAHRPTPRSRHPPRRG